MTLTISQYQAETDSLGLQWTNLRALGGTTESLANVPAGTARGTVVATTTGTYKTVTALAHAGGSRGDILILRSSVAGSVRTPVL
jgi:hypothetical protein